jgi:hypothetical protein
MAQFDKLQELWQQQSGPAVSAADAARLAQSMQAYRRRQAWINAGKTVVIAAVFAGTISRARLTPGAIVGFSLIGLAAAALLIREFRSQQAIASLDFGAPSLGFVRETIARLNDHRESIRRYYWPMMGSMVIGLNLILTGTHRLWPRILASGLPFLAFELGMRVRRRRFEVECRPLLEQLSAMRAALEDRVE